ncbi:helix-turn-helix domain-containing protein [uncultured Parabacteroides sp.]|uniref:helix-turn-helix domain-containing protein n=1 Tax=uncultured Parabacteroides sp. TaxID=512312 RepID=UPI0028063062|nr:helix-turn-helix domain-containing protein [uncultured Parabacteroides sp.]
MEVITMESRAYLRLMEKLDSITAYVEEAVRREEEARKRTGEDSVSDGKWMTGKEVCEALGISSRTLQRYRMQGEVSYSQYGKNLRYPRAEIDAFVEKRLVRTTSEQVDRLTEGYAMTLKRKGGAR